MNNKNDLELATHDLPSEVAKQASLYAYYAGEAVNARADRDSAVNRLTQVTAQLEVEFRQASAAAGVKITEGVVRAHLDSHPTLVEMKSEVVELNKAFGTLDTMARAMDHKKSMIELAVRMSLNSIYANNENNGDIPQAVADGLRDVLNKEG